MTPDNGLGAILNYLATIKLPTSKEGYNWQGRQLFGLADDSYVVLSVAVMTSIIKIKTLVDIDQLTALQSWLADNQLTQWTVNHELIFNAVYSVAIVHSSIEEQ